MSARARKAPARPLDRGWRCPGPALAAGILLGAALLEMLPEGLARAFASGSTLPVGGDRLGGDPGDLVPLVPGGAIAASSYGVNRLASRGLILPLLPEVAAVIALLTAVGLSLRQALRRNLLTGAMIGLGFVVVALLPPGLPPSTPASALAFAGGGFLALACFGWPAAWWSSCWAC